MNSTDIVKQAICELLSGDIERHMTYVADDVTIYAGTKDSDGPVRGAAAYRQSISDSLDGEVMNLLHGFRITTVNKGGERDGIVQALIYVRTLYESAYHGNTARSRSEGCLQLIVKVSNDKITIIIPRVAEMDVPKLNDSSAHDLANSTVREALCTLVAGDIDHHLSYMADDVSLAFSGGSEPGHAGQGFALTSKGIEGYRRWILDRNYSTPKLSEVLMGFRILDTDNVTKEGGSTTLQVLLYIQTEVDMPDGRAIPSEVSDTAWMTLKVARGKIASIAIEPDRTFGSQRWMNPHPWSGVFDTES